VQYLYKVLAYKDKKKFLKLKYFLRSSSATPAFFDSLLQIFLLYKVIILLFTNKTTSFLLSYLICYLSIREANRIKHISLSLPLKII
jgi:hypothetical protein